MKKSIVLFIIAVVTSCHLHSENLRLDSLLTEGWTIKNIFEVQKKARRDSVVIPHTWNEDFIPGTTYYDRGMRVYEKKLSFPRTKQDSSRIFLLFEGANSVANVLVNKRSVGEHKGGYTAFCLEITDAVKDGDNDLEVWVSNAMRTDVLPISGDFNVNGGLHRPVHLIITASDDCIAPDYYGSPGVFIQQEKITPDRAKLNIITRLNLRSDLYDGLSVKATVKDDEGKIVATETASVSNDTLSVIPVEITDPHLWQGKEDPYLYTVDVTLLRNGVPVDQVTQRTGLRDIYVDPERGFFLNGKYLDLYGFCRHEDMEGKASAMGREDYARDMDFVLESGATAMRLAHYPHSTPFYDLADENGIILWTETPMCGPGGMTYTGYLNTVKENALQTTKELVLQKYNHPSICFWGIFNEILTDSGDTFKGYDDPIPTVKEINALFHTLDPSRPTAFATCVDQNNYADCADLIGWNKYFGWYSDATAGASRFFDSSHEMAGKVPVGVSEYGAGASPNHHIPFEQLERQADASADDGGNAGPTGGLRPDSRFHPEEAQTFCHERNWAVYRERPYLWAKFIWLFADIKSYQRREGEKDGINDKGMLTRDRATRKDAFYFYKAQWNPEPMIYITSRRYVDRKENPVSVKVYTTLAETTLYVNGKEIGTVKTDDLHRAVWHNVSLRPGANLIEVSGRQGDRVLRDSCEWNYSPDKLSVL